MPPTKRIQYFWPDLSEALGIGPITDVHTSAVAGVPVLRIEYEDTEPKGAYKTVKATKRARQKKQPVMKEPRFAETRPESLGGRLLDHTSGFLKNVEKPGFMRDTGF